MLLFCCLFAYLGKVFHGFLWVENEGFGKSILVRWVFPGGPMMRKLPANAGDVRDVGLISGSGRSPGGGQDNPLQYSYPWTFLLLSMENPMDRGAWKSTVHRVAKSDTTKWLSTHIDEMIDSNRRAFCVGLKLRKLNFRCLNFFFFKRTGCGKERSPESHHEDGLL